jgi:hypothetical protein
MYSTQQQSNSLKCYKILCELFHILVCIYATSIKETVIQKYEHVYTYKIIYIQTYVHVLYTYIYYVHIHTYIHTRTQYI